MLTRLRRRLSTRPAMTPIDAHWALNHKVEHLYQLNAEANARIGDEIAAAVAGYLADFQRRAAVIEEHLDALAQAAREHAEAAAANAADAVRVAAREHTDAATQASFHEAISTSRAHAEAAAHEALTSAIEALDTRTKELRLDSEEQLALLRRRIDHVRQTADSVG